MTKDKRRGIQSIEIGFRVLKALEAAARPLTLSEIAQATRLSPSRTQFYLVSLLRVGVVVQAEPGGPYGLGPTAIRLGLTALAQLDVLEMARATMIELRERTGHTVFISVWGTHGPTVVNRLDGAKSTPLGVRVGAIMPLLGSATGKTFLAYLPRAVTADLVRREIISRRRGGATKTSATHVERVIADVRSWGAARTRGSVAQGIVAMAAPVVDYQGTLTCVMTLMGYERVVDIDYRSDDARALGEAARAVSRSCGFVGEIWSVAKTRALA